MDYDDNKRCETNDINNNLKLNNKMKRSSSMQGFKFASNPH